MESDLKKLLYEIDSLQNDINRHRPFEKSLLKQIKEYFRIGLTYSSNALEGNSLTEIETKIVLEEGIAIGGKPLKDHLEAVGHSDAFNHMYELSNKKDITEHDIKMLHKLFYLKIDEKDAGAYRKVRAFITGSKYPLPLPEELPTRMAGFVDTVREYRTTTHPVITAALMHKDFVFIHLFVDGNGRVGRLLMNLVLLQEGYTIVTIPPIVRKDYIGALERAHEDDMEFILFIARMVRQTQRDFVRIFVD